jgi:hypothetical protein
MASVLRRKSARTAAPENRARTLVRDATKEADRLTLHVLKTGRSLVSGGQAAQAAQAAQTNKQKRAGESGSALPAAALAQVAPIGLKADPTPQLQAAAPIFGDVLRSIGAAVAVTQTALDDTALESLKTLAGQKVDVPMLIEQTLLDDGTPDISPGGVKITTASMPLTSIVTPSMQQVDQMTLRMDMSVASFDATSGIKFNQNMAGAGVGYSRGSFGFALSMSNTNVNAQFSNMSDYSSGSVLMSMDIVDRTGFQIPTPLEYGIGANLLVRLTGIAQTSAAGAQTTPPAPPNPPTITRTATLTVSEVKRDGSVAALNSGQYDVIVPPGLLPVESASGGTLTISYNPAKPTDPYVERKGTIILGQLTKDFTFHL